MPARLEPAFRRVLFRQLLFRDDAVARDADRHRARRPHARALPRPTSAGYVVDDEDRRDLAAGEVSALRRPVSSRSRRTRSGPAARAATSGDEQRHAAMRHGYFFFFWRGIFSPGPRSRREYAPRARPGSRRRPRVLSAMPRQITFRSPTVPGSSASSTSDPLVTTLNDVVARRETGAVPSRARPGGTAHVLAARPTVTST